MQLHLISQNLSHTIGGSSVCLCLCLAALAKKISAAVHNQAAEDTSDEDDGQLDDLMEDDDVIEDDVGHMDEGPEGEDLDWGPVTKRPRSQRTQRASSTSMQAHAAAGAVP